MTAAWGTGSARSVRLPWADLWAEKPMFMPFLADYRQVPFRARTPPRLPLDSTTLSLLLAASRRQHARGDELLVLVGPQTPMTAFEVTGFNRLLAIRRVDDDPPRMRHVSTTHLPEEEPDAAETRPLAMPASLEVHEAPRRENDQDSGPAPLQGMLPVGQLGVAAHREVSSETARQIARRALFREVNERINEIAGDFCVAEGFSILCECASSASFRKTTAS